MKKILFAVMAMVAIGFASCGNKAQQAEAEAADSVQQDSIALLTQGTIDQINEVLEKKDAAQLSELLGTVHVQVAEFIKKDPEQAAEYVTMVQNFLKENAEKIQAVVGDNAAAKAAVEALTSVEPEGIINSVLDQMGAEDAADAADAAAKAVK
jgi:hypothetical protein